MDFLYGATVKQYKIGYDIELSERSDDDYTGAWADTQDKIFTSEKARDVWVEEQERLLDIEED